MSACCDAATRAKCVTKILAWVVPGAGLMLVPKCPACLAAYVTLWTGIGVSLATATYLRWALLLLCGATLLFLMGRSTSLRAVFGYCVCYFKKETEPCHIP
jgi:hypothetical protein